MQLIDLSHLVTTGMAVYPGDETVPTIERLVSHGAETHQVSALSMGCHAGTHIDLPLHFLAGQPGLDAYPLSRCLGRGVVVDTDPGEIPPSALDGTDLASVDFVVFRTGWERHWGSPRYYDGWPWLAAETSRLLADADLMGVGLDSPSIDTFGETASHDILARAGCLNIENLANLAQLPSTEFQLLVLPLKLDGAEASPVRAAALISPKE